MPPRLIVEDFVLKNGTFKLAAAVCTGRMTFPAFKFLLWEFFFLILDFYLTFQYAFSPRQIERCLCQEISSEGTQDTTLHKKKVWCRRRENIRSIAKILFCFVFHSFETFQQLWVIKKCNLLTTFYMECQLCVIWNSWDNNSQMRGL